jgi:hypothetical protein
MLRVSDAISREGLSKKALKRELGGLYPPPARGGAGRKDSPSQGSPLGRSTNPG